MRQTKLIWIALICLAVIASIAAIGGASRGHAYSSARWEYQLTFIKTSGEGSAGEPEKTLNQLGSEGWELVEVLTGDQMPGRSGYFLFKRSK